MRSRSWGLRAGLPAVMAATALLVLASGCSGGGGGTSGGTVGTSPAAPDLVFIGLDSADWRLLDPMLAEGRLPHLKAFRAQAASGRMQSFYPLEKSPLLWASICTGVEPAVHGIDHFVRGGDQKPVTSSAWHAPAVWDILGAAGRSTFISGMWTTYPARPINGVMVSDYLPYGAGRTKPLAGLVYPDSLVNAIVNCRVDPQTLGADQLARFLPPGADLAELEKSHPRQIKMLREVWASDLGYLNVARLMKERGGFDLFFFYLRGPDMISHGFYRYLVADPATWAGDPNALVAFRDVVKRYYDWTDEVVGEVLSWFPADQPTIISSDHGFYGPRPEGSGTAEHSEWGIFLVRSPLHVPGADFGHLKLLDICPTMLAMLNLPPAQDMPGVVLAAGLTDEGRKRMEHIEKNRVPSYLALRPAVGSGTVEADDKVEEEIRRQLRSLGYIN